MTGKNSTAGWLLIAVALTAVFPAIAGAHGGGCKKAPDNAAMWTGASALFTAIK